jgi:hypothetical protein
MRRGTNESSGTGGRHTRRVAAENALSGLPNHQSVTARFHCQHPPIAFPAHEFHAQDLVHRLAAYEDCMAKLRPLLRPEQQPAVDRLRERALRTFGRPED